MTREGRLLLLTVLTYTLYAFSIWTSKGLFIFPFPLNEAVIFVITAQLAFQSRKELLNALHIALIGIVALLTSFPFWEIVLSEERLALFYTSGWPDLLLLVFYVLLAVLMIRTVIAQNRWPAFLFGGIALAVLVTSLVLSEPLWMLPAYLLMTVSIGIRPALGVVSWIWPFLVFLESVRIISFVTGSVQ